MSTFGRFIDDAQDVASWIDNKPVFADEYMAEGIDMLMRQHNVPRHLALNAIIYYVSTPAGRVAAQKLS